MNKLLLIDGNSIMNRAFYGIPDMTTNDGRHTNAIYGFLNIILNLFLAHQVTRIHSAKPESMNDHISDSMPYDLKRKTAAIIKNIF